MRCPHPKSNAVLLATLVLALTVLRAEAAPDETRVLHGPAIAPRTVDFRVLPRLVGLYNGPRLVREEAHHAVIDSIVEELKEHPRPPSITELGAVTLDTGGGEQQPLAPVAGTGFEGIT